MRTEWQTANQPVWPDLLPWPQPEQDGSGLTLVPAPPVSRSRGVRCCECCANYFIRRGAADGGRREQAFWASFFVTCCSLTSNCVSGSTSPLNTGKSALIAPKRFPHAGSTRVSVWVCVCACVRVCVFVCLCVFVYVFLHFVSLTLYLNTMQIHFDCLLNHLVALIIYCLYNTWHALNDKIDDRASLTTIKQWLHCWSSKLFVWLFFEIL